MKKRPLELLEESLQILRSGGAEILILHWTGALPFAISWLLLLRDTSFTWGRGLLLRDSLSCAVAFLWLSYWRSFASRKTLLLLSPTIEQQPAGGWWNRLALQVIFQTGKLFVMPLAMASVLAWPAASTFFRTLALEPLSPDRAILGILRRAFAVAAQSYIQSSIAFLTMAGFALIVFLNVLITLALLPSLWKMLTGYETDWSRMENSSAILSLFSVAAIATWFLIDPWIQTSAVLRVFYSNARSDGRDLLRDLSRIAAIGLLCVFCTGMQAATNRQQDLDRAISSAASQDVNYGWLHPAESSSQDGFLASLAKKVNDAYSSARDHVKKWLKAISYWLRDLFGNKPLSVDDSKKGKPRSTELRWTLGILAVLVCGLIVAIFLRTGKAPNSEATAANATAAVADVLNETLLPSDVNQEEWLRLAFQYLADNQTRLAARAFYLANLSYLGAKSLLALSLSKSNRIYERELARQPKAGNLVSAFVAANRLYERAWYGVRELESHQMETLKVAADQLRQHHA